uniref:PI3K/PI4K catalytic domain-containing protein n=1 Tax=Arcella intermedia TaxID=1963864 RepID=A0A6B2LE81_9EUKA
MLKVFDSKARPILLEMRGTSSTKNVICKIGDDLRNDWYIQTVFHLFNLIWEKEGKKLDVVPFLYRYRCTPIATGRVHKLGCIECVPNVCSALEFDWNSVNTLAPEQKKKFFGSLAGSFVASYVLGIRDRHQDNMLIKDNHIFFHIDFGHLFNQGPLVDAPRIAIPQRLKSAISQEEWDKYVVDLSVETFILLRKYTTLIKRICSTLFRTTNEKVDFIEEFLLGNSSLMIGMDEEQARCKFRKTIIKSANKFNWKRKLKNWAHNVGKE